ncbi:hypothetical protein KXJ74_10095 [Acinetobacter johnsonii]|nr:hypothetical protein KXJ74_10095 [Acinetobacter johnsonii]
MNKLLVALGLTATVALVGCNKEKAPETGATTGEHLENAPAKQLTTLKMRDHAASETTAAADHAAAKIDAAADEAAAKTEAAAHDVKEVTKEATADAAAAVEKGAADVKEKAQH